MIEHKEDIIKGLIFIAGAILLGYLCAYAIGKLSEEEAVTGILQADLPIDTKQELRQALKNPEFIEFLKEVA